MGRVYCALQPAFSLCSGVDHGSDLPRAFLEYLYDSIVTNEIRMLSKAPGAAPPGSGAAPAATVSALLLPQGGAAGAWAATIPPGQLRVAHAAALLR